jgi:hypothetical protein
MGICETPFEKEHIVRRVLDEENQLFRFRHSEGGTLAGGNR